jgi:hypothetical protein
MASFKRDPQKRGNPNEEKNTVDNDRNISDSELRVCMGRRSPAAAIPALWSFYVHSEPPYRNHIEHAVGGQRALGVLPDLDSAQYVDGSKRATLGSQANDGVTPLP